jgi:hypothetical protein
MDMVILMKMKRLITALILVIAFPVFAQSTLTFVSEDGAVSFAHPAAWQVTDRGDGLISLEQPDTTFVTLLTPNALAQLNLDAEIDPARVAQGVALARGYTPTELALFTSNNVIAARQDYTSTETPAGFILTFPVGEGGLVTFDATTSGDSRLLQRDLEILMTSFVYTVNPEPPSPYLTFTADEGGLAFEYPRAWQAVDNGAGTATLTTPDFTATLFAPAALNQYADLDDPARLVSAALENQRLTPGAFNVFLSSRRPAARFDYTDAAQQPGFFLAFALADGELALMQVQPASTGNPALIQKDFELLAATLVTDASAPLAIATNAPAQPSPTPGIVTFVSKDGTVTLTHSADWFVGEDDTGKIYGFLGDPAISLTLYPPEALISQRYLMNGEAPDAFLARYRSNFGLQLGAITPLTMGEFAGARRAVTLDAGGEFIALQLPGGAYAIAESFMFSGELTDAARERAEEVLSTLQYSGQVVAEENPEAPPLPELAEYNNGLRAATQELEDLRLIPFGGRYLYEESYLYYFGVGETPVRLTSLSASNNLVMGGTITFQPGGENPEPTDYCALGVRRSVESGSPGVLKFGLMAEGLIFYEDQPRTAGDALRGEAVRLDGALTDPHHFLIIVVDDRMTLFVDGKPTFTEVEVEDRAGIYALIPRSSQRGSSCEAQDMWIFTLPEVVTPGVCEIQTVGQVNKRRGPGTNFDVVGELAGFISAPVIGQTIGEDGFRWWQLEDQSYVRADIVNVAGDCSQLIEPEATSEATSEATAEATETP